MQFLCYLQDTTLEIPRIPWFKKNLRKIHTLLGCTINLKVKSFIKKNFNKKFFFQILLYIINSWVNNLSDFVLFDYRVEWVTKRYCNTWPPRRVYKIRYTEIRNVTDSGRQYGSKSKFIYNSSFVGQ